MRSLPVFLIFGFIASFVYAETLCNSTASCPEDLPCCSQYGYCGTGAVCLGGCDPRYSYNLTACMPQPIMSTFSDDMSSLDTLVDYNTYLGNSSEANWVYSGYVASYNSALLIQMPNETSGTVVSSSKYLWYGKVGATVKSSHGAGVVTAFIMFSDVEDEIDWEFVGYNLTSVETNFYARGILNYSNADTVVTTDTFSNWHYYELDWQEESITWLIDGVTVRTLNKDDTWNTTTDRYDYPQTPSRVQFSLWPGGASSNSEGTIEWAGGAIDWDADDIVDYGYFYAYVKNVSVEAYDWPSTVGRYLNTSAYTGFLYNSTDGLEEDVYLTTEKTWLGSESASGLDPDNEDEVVVETAVVSSGSTTYTTTKTSTSSAAATGTSTSSTSTSTYTGGFQQNESSTTSGSGARVAVQSLLTYLALAAGFVGF